MPKKQTVGFVTNDNFMKDGLRDPDDEAIIREMQKGGLRVKFINPEQLLNIMQKQEPAKYEQFKAHFENKFFKRLTREDLVALCKAGDARMMEFDQLTQWISQFEAMTIREWRVHKRMTWRAVARAAHIHWWWARVIDPPSNQLAGMSLCRYAAERLSENYMKPPWN